MKIYKAQASPVKCISKFFIITLMLSIVSLGAIQIQRISVIDKLATDYVGSTRNHALIIGIIRKGKQDVYTFGETEKGSGVKPNENAIFELGTVSEVFTTSLLALMESEGKISSLDAVGDVLKGKVKVPYYQRIICNPPPINSKVEPKDMSVYQGNICYPDPKDAPQMMVLCDLATHSAGLPSEPPPNVFNPKNPYANYTADKLSHYVANLSPSQAFGYKYNQSLIGMALLGQALSVKSGKDYATLLKEQILTPLSMKHTFVSPTTEQAALFISGHTAKGKLNNHRDYNALTPAAGIRSSVPDLLQFVGANLKSDTPFNIALSETQIPRLYTDPAGGPYMIGWGWISKQFSDKNRKRLFWRCGEQGGFASFVGFIKESNVGIVILSNSSTRVEDMGLKILEYLESVPTTVSVN
jgi:serine-type D-Ala-D-Ala carboxypeptidase/endopeptidase